MFLAENLMLFARLNILSDTLPECTDAFELSELTAVFTSNFDF